MVLKGVLVGEDATRSRALIAYGETEPRLYKPDDKLPDGSVLKTVNNKNVEVEKDGETSSLTLDRGRPSATPQDAETQAPETEPTVTQPVSDASVTANAEPGPASE